MIIFADHLYTFATAHMATTNILRCTGAGTSIAKFDELEIVVHTIFIFGAIIRTVILMNNSSVI